MTNKLELTMPEGPISQYEMFEILEKIYDAESHATIEDILSQHDIARGCGLAEDAEREKKDRVGDNLFNIFWHIKS